MSVSAIFGQNTKEGRSALVECRDLPWRSLRTVAHLAIYGLVISGLVPDTRRMHAAYSLSDQSGLTRARARRRLLRSLSISCYYAFQNGI